MNYARYIGWSQNDLDGAETIYRGLLEENRHESQMSWLRFALAELLHKKGDRFTALALVEEILKQELSPDGETDSRLREVTLELREMIKE